MTEISSGEILLKEFCEPKGITLEQLAAHIGLPPHRMNDLAQGIQPITDDIALSLGLFFNMEAGFWRNLQSEYDRRMDRGPRKATDEK